MQKETAWPMSLLTVPLDDALRLETLHGYSSAGDFKEARQRLAAFFAKRQEP